MKRAFFGLGLGLLFATVGMVRVSYAANPTGSCKVKAHFIYQGGVWKMDGAACGNACPASGGHAGTCVEYQVTGGTTPTYTCACRYSYLNEAGEPVVEYAYSAQVCDGFYQRDTANGNAIIPTSHYCSGPCSPQVCKKDGMFPEHPPENHTVSDVGCACQN
jgi:hypothetical protein